MPEITTTLERETQARKIIYQIISKGYMSLAELGVALKQNDAEWVISYNPNKENGTSIIPRLVDEGMLVASEGAERIFWDCGAILLEREMQNNSNSIFLSMSSFGSIEYGKLV